MTNQTWQELLPAGAISPEELISRSADWVERTVVSFYRSSRYAYHCWASEEEVLGGVFRKLRAMLLKAKMPNDVEHYTRLIWRMSVYVGKDYQRTRLTEAERTKQVSGNSDELSIPAPEVDLDFTTIEEAFLIGYTNAHGILTEKQSDVLKERLLQPKPTQPTRMRSAKASRPSWKHIGRQLTIDASTAQEHYFDALRKLERYHFQDFLTSNLPAIFYRLGNTPQRLSAVVEAFVSVQIYAEKLCNRRPLRDVLKETRLDLEPGVEPLPGFTLERLISGNGKMEFWLARLAGNIPVGMKFRPYADLSWLPDGLAGGLCTAMNSAGNDFAYLYFLALPWVIVLCEPAKHRILEDIFHFIGPSVIKQMKALREIHLLNQQGMLINYVDPGNLAVAENGDIRIVDFGRVGGVNSPQRADDDEFRAPEIAFGKPAIQSDQFSFALTYFCLRTGGRLPYKEKGKARVNEVPDLRLLTPVEQRVISRALNPDPNSRWPSLLDLENELLNG